MITKYAEAFKKAPSWIYKAGAQLYIDKVYPRHLFLEVTASCNLSCDYCPREKVNKHMDFSLFTRIIDEATAHGPRSFSLHLFGEPLLYPRIWDAIRYIKEKDKRHTILLTSNGTLFERFINELTESPVDKIIWSWRPEAKFSNATKEKLRTWGKLTVRMIEEVVPKEERDYWENWPSVEKRKLHNYGGKIDTSKWNILNYINKDDNLSRWSCYHLSYAPAIAFNGDILICCSDPKRESRIGNIKDMSMTEAWQSNTFKRLREEHLKGVYSGICENCDVWKAYPNTFFGHEFPIKKN